MQIERSKKIFNKINMKEYTLEELDKILSENTFKNFIDPSFPPIKSSVY